MIHNNHVSSTRIVAGCETCEHRVVRDMSKGAVVNTAGIDLSSVPLEMTEYIDINLEESGLVFDPPNVILRGTIRLQNQFTVYDEERYKQAGTCPNKDRLARIDADLARRAVNNFRQDQQG